MRKNKGINIIKESEKILNSKNKYELRSPESIYSIIDKDIITSDNSMYIFSLNTKLEAVGVDKVDTFKDFLNDEKTRINLYRSVLLKSGKFTIVAISKDTKLEIINSARLESDINNTFYKIYKDLKILGVDCLDYIICGDLDYISYKKEGVF